MAAPNRTKWTKTMSGNTGAEAKKKGEGLIALLYAILWGTAELAVRPLALQGRTRWQEKLGIYDTHAAGPRCWIHACSVGEVRVALRCMAALRQRNPRLCFTLSAVTPEGLAAARDGVTEAKDRVVLFPFDSRRAMRRAFDSIRPSLVILTEVELWPAHLREAERRGIPVFVVNGRLTGADERRYRLAGSFMRRTFSIPELVCARGPEEAAIFERLGARQVGLAGDMKYETLQPARVSTVLRSSNLLLGASTHEGEETILLRTARKLRAQFPRLLLTIVPRHPNRAGSVAAMAERAGFRAGLSSCGTADLEVTVVDEVGGLAKYYCQATLCFVGKSLTAKGGQNFLEAAAAGCPVVIGPHVENFSHAASLFLRSGALVQVRDEIGLHRQLHRLLADEAAREQMRDSAYRIVESNQGASARVADLILARTGKRLG
jgi:3-deoxy-D-manno-octulosonic-acid transferase